MKFKASAVASFKDAKQLDGVVDYIAIPITGSKEAGGVPIGTAKEIMSITSKSRPVASIYRGTIPWTVETARKIDAGIVEYSMPVPSVSAAILAEMLDRYGIRLGALIVWDKKWIPEDPLRYSKSLSTLARNIEYVVMHFKRGHPERLDMMPDLGIGSYGVSYTIVRDKRIVCDMLRLNINLIDVDLAKAGSTSSALEIVERIRGALNDCGHG